MNCCQFGHELTSESTMPKGQRICRLCTNIYSAAYRRNKRRKRGLKQHKFYCLNGHIKTPENTRKGKRDCLICHRERELKRNRAKGVLPRNPKSNIPLNLQRIKWEQTRRTKKYKQFIEHVDPVKLFQRDDGVCGICKKLIINQKFEVDHIIPLSKGGKHSYANTQISHPICNRKKYNTLK